MNHIEEELEATLARRASAVPSPIGLAEVIRRRHGEQRRRRVLVSAVSGIAAVTLVTGGVTMIDLPGTGAASTGYSAASGPTPSSTAEPSASPSDTAEPSPSPSGSEPDPGPSTSQEPSPSPSEPATVPSPSSTAPSSAPRSQPAGTLQWPARGTCRNKKEMRDFASEEWDSVIRDYTPEVVLPLGLSPRFLRVLLCTDTPRNTIAVLQGTDETNRDMLSVYGGGFGDSRPFTPDSLRLLNRGLVDKYRVSSSDLLRFVHDDTVFLVTPPNATASISTTPGEGGKPVFTPVPLEDGLLAVPVTEKGQQVQVKVGSTIVYQGPIVPDPLPVNLTDPDLIDL